MTGRTSCFWRTPIRRSSRRSARLASRRASRGWLCRFWPAGPARCVKHRQSAARKSALGRSVMFGDFVWLCSTHPKPSPTMFWGLPASIRQGSRESAEIVLKTWAGRTPKSRSHPCVVGSQNGRLPGVVGAHPRRAGPKLEKIGARHGV